MKHIDILAEAIAAKYFPNDPFRRKALAQDIEYVSKMAIVREMDIISFIHDN